MCTLPWAFSPFPIFKLIYKSMYMCVCIYTHAHIHTHTIKHSKTRTLIILRTQLISIPYDKGD